MLDWWLVNIAPHCTCMEMNVWHDDWVTTLLCWTAGEGLWARYNHFGVVCFKWEDGWLGHLQRFAADGEARMATKCSWRLGYFNWRKPTEGRKRKVGQCWCWDHCEHNPFKEEGLRAARLRLWWTSTFTSSTRKGPAQTVVGYLRGITCSTVALVILIIPCRCLGAFNAAQIPH